MVITSQGMASLESYNRVDGVQYVFAYARDNDATPKNRLVSVAYDMEDGNVVWRATKAFINGGSFEMMGVALAAAEKDDLIPVAIYGAVKNVTLPAAVTKTQTNNSIGRGGSRTAPTGVISIMSENNVNAQAFITDAKTGSANGRDLWLFGRLYVCETLFPNLGRVRDASNKRPSQTLVSGLGGEFYLNVDAENGLNKGDLTLLRRGTTGTWKATYTGGNRGNVAADNVFCFGVPTQDVTGATGAVGRVQVGGWADIDIGTALNIGKGGVAAWTRGASLAANNDMRNRNAIFAIDAAKNSKDQRGYLLGRIFID